MNKAIFLDRDGVINDNSGGYYIINIDDFILNKGIIESLETFTNHGFLLIIISNQGGIAKGLYAKNDCELIHEHLKKLLLPQGISITEIYYCPHHPDHGNCLCRKPGSLLFEKAIARFQINPGESWMIGDSEGDIMAAEKVGLRTIKIESNEDIRKYVDRMVGISSNRDSQEN
jgi:D-glycero-D-manno-heptose 1,7-bisphosphate phosphatase